MFSSVKLISLYELLSLLPLHLSRCFQFLSLFSRWRHICMSQLTSIIPHIYIYILFRIAWRGERTKIIKTWNLNPIDSLKEDLTSQRLQLLSRDHSKVSYSMYFPLPSTSTRLFPKLNSNTSTLAYTCTFLSELSKVNSEQLCALEIHLIGA